MGLQNKFSSDDPYVLSALIATARNNQADLNVAIQEQDFLRATSAIQQQAGLTGTVANPVPNVTAVAQGTVGQAGNPSTPNPPCFIGSTLITLPDSRIFISEMKCGMMVLAFDHKTGKRIPKMVTDTQSHLIESYCELTFEGGSTTGVDAEQVHKYWTFGDFDSVKDLDFVYNWQDAWKQRRIIDRQMIKKQVILYNFTVEDLHDYIANGDAVSNLKPHE